MNDLFQMHSSFHPEDTEALGRQLATALGTPSTILCFGELGAGKTCFAKGFVSAATGCPMGEIQSPTFTYLNSYDGSKAVHHFDLYRMNGPAEFYDLGFDDFLNEDALCILEWAERLEEHLPPNYIAVHITHQGPTERRIVITKEASHV